MISQEERGMWTQKELADEEKSPTKGHKHGFLSIYPPSTGCHLQSRKTIYLTALRHVGWGMIQSFSNQ